MGAPQAVPLLSPQVSGQQGPTYLLSDHRVEACWGPLGALEERQGCGSPWMLGSALLSFVLQETKRFHY